MDARFRFREGRHFAGVTEPIWSLVMPAEAGIHLCCGLWWSVSCGETEGCSLNGLYRSMLFEEEPR